jgi:sugar lactone lactonase YvrE
VVFAELGSGRLLSLQSGDVRVLAKELYEPIGVAIDADGACLVAEAGAGRVIRVSGSTIDTVIADLQRPQGILVRDGVLYVVDAGAKELIAFDPTTSARRTVASGLPVGPPPGVTPKPLRGMPPFSGPQGPFAGITASADGTLYVSADGEGSVLALRPRPDGP